LSPRQPGLGTADTIVDHLLGLAVLHLATSGTSTDLWAKTRDPHTVALADDAS
jgi:hypothetical protein